MSWSVQEVGQILTLAEAGELSRDDLARAARIAPLRPSRTTWLLAVDRLFALAGALLLAAAVVFFFAYNWADLHRFAKLAVACVALAGCVGVAAFSAPFGIVYRAALLGACITTGALLALIGQTYQTGADLWELFLAWATLMLPFVLLARSSASWALWLLVANLALARGLSQSGWSVTLGDWFGPVGVLLLAGLNLAALLLFETLGPRLLSLPRRHIARLAAAGIIVPLTAGAMIGCWGGKYVAVTMVFAAVIAAGFKAYLELRRDLVMLAFVTFSAIAVVTTGMFRVLVELASAGGEEGAVFLIVATFVYPLTALALIGGSVLAARWILQLHREDRSA